MNMEEIKQELLRQGQDPNDFDILINEFGYTKVPKWFYENKQIAKEQDLAIEATFTYDSMMKDVRIDQAESTQADLMYQLMTKGVL